MFEKQYSNGGINMILEDVILLAATTIRTKAYLQEMIKSNFIPSFCIILTDSISTLKEEKELDYAESEENRYFNEREPLLITLDNNSIKYILIENKDVNSAAVYESLCKLQQKYIIYSGYGGSILKAHLFQMNKKFIHIHAGELPAYRGSTTAYYSILDDKSISATAIFMNEGIDEGSIIVSRKYSVTNENIDYIFEPHIRSLVLIEALKLYIEKKEFPVLDQKSEKVETYYIIHPVLKHIAMISIRDR